MKPIATLTLLALLLIGAAPSIPAGQAATLFKEAEDLSRKNQKTEALAKAEAAAAEMTRAVAAGEKLEWQEMNGLRWAARLAREDFLDYDKSQFFCDKMMELADGEYWRVPARLEIARIHRAQKQYDQAQQIYDQIAKGDERERYQMQLPEAEMLLFEKDDRKKGTARMKAALSNTKISGWERIAALRRCATVAMNNGQRAEALEWYAMTETLPFEKAEERERFLAEALYEMGRIEESLGRLDQAKALYRRAMELQDGDMRYRAQARDALETLEYFE